MTIAQIESRLHALEVEVSRLKAKEATKPIQSNQFVGTGPIHTKAWLEKIRGSFAGDPAFLEAMRHGRKWRESDRPKPRRKQAKHNQARRHK